MLAASLGHGAAWWATFVALVATLAIVLHFAVLCFPWPRQRTMQVTAILPVTPERAWHAYLAGNRLRTPGASFETALPGDILALESSVGIDDRETCEVEVRVIDNAPGRHLVMQPLGCNGAPFPGGPAALDGVLLEAHPEGTRMTLFLQLRTPNLLHVRYMRLALALTLAKIERRIAPGRPSPAAPA